MAETTLAEPATTSSARARLEVLVVGLAALMVSLSQSLLVPVLPILPEKLHTSAANVEWLLTSTLLVGAVAVPTFGRLGDMFGKRRLLLIAVAALTVGSLLDAVTSNLGLLIVGRAIQGASLAGIPLGISLLSSLLPRARVPSAIALISAMLGVGGSLGLPLAQGSEWGWSSLRTVGLLVIAVVMLAIFVAYELRVHDPLVDIRATMRRPIVLTNVASILFGFALFASLIGTASYVEAPTASGYGFGSSIVVGGLCLLPSGLVMLLLSPLAARLIHAWGAHRTLTVAGLLLALGWVSRIVLTGTLGQIVVGTTIVGAATGIGYATMPALINRNTPPTEISAANGLNSLARSFGSSLASAVGGSMLTASTIVVAGVALPSLGAYRALFAACAVAAGLAAVAALFIPHSDDAYA